MDPTSLNALEFSARHLMTVSQIAAILAQIMAEETDSEQRLERVREVDSRLQQNPGSRVEILPAASAFFDGEQARAIVTRWHWEPNTPLSGLIMADVSA